MNVIKQLLGTILICLVLQYFLPWWSLVIGAFIAGFLFNNKGFPSFIAGFLGVALLWVLYALIIDIQTQSILTDKVAKLFPTQSNGLLFVLTVVVGGLPAGFAALTGSLLRSMK